jgi:general secretion pathway protein A
MYEKFYGLRERPFDLTPDPRYFVLTDSHREALSNLEYAIASRKGITLLIGESGSGKTTVISTALQNQKATVHCIHLTNPALTRQEFVEMLAARFELTEHARTSKAALLLELEELLRRRREAGETTVLIVDEAQSLSYELLEEVRLLANLESQNEKLLSLIIAGQPELSNQLNQDNLRQLKQRVALRCELKALTQPEAMAYFAGRIKAAGGVAAQVFSREAVALLHEHARGIPRVMNVLADNALIAGFAHGKLPVTSDIVKEVARDFHIGVAASPDTFTAESRARHVMTVEPAPAARVAAGTVAQPAPATDAGEPRPGLFADVGASRWRFPFFRRREIA